MNYISLCSFTYIDILIIVGVIGYVFLLRRKADKGPTLAQFFKDKRVFITGGNSGIGKALAIKLASFGAELIITGRDEERLQEVVDTCKDKYSAKIKSYRLDMSNPAHVEGWCFEKGDEIEMLDVLIHNAGVSMRGKLLEVEVEVGEKILNVDFLSVFAMTKALMGRMKTQGNGSVV
jgi:short-subunit dehydrogenase